MRFSASISALALLSIPLTAAQPASKKSLANAHQMPRSNSNHLGKRLVRKKKRGCQNPVTPTLITSGALANSTSSSSAAPAVTSTPSSGSSAWNLVADWAGNSFFDNWDFWSYDDPTHGTVDYVSASEAWNSGLVSVNSEGHAIMKVDTTQQISGRGRKAVRLHGHITFTGGLVIMDSYHMPTGCGTWPAWWQNGPNWPNGGEIDIVEGVNAFTQNQVSLHTGSGCSMPGDFASSGAQTGTLLTGGYDAYNCDSYATANQGCGVRDLTGSNSYGEKFNNIKGGVYALLWGKQGVTVWWFPRGQIPSDITNKAPDHLSWPTPQAHFPADNCDPYRSYGGMGSNMYSIFTNTFCGDWAGAGGIWNYGGFAGQEQSCASKTGYATCDEYVRNMGNAFHDAYWEVGSIQYYNSTQYV